MIPWELVNSRKLFGWRLPTDGENKFVRDSVNYLPIHTASKSRRHIFSIGVRTQNILILCLFDEAVVIVMKV